MLRPVISILICIISVSAIYAQVPGSIKCKVSGNDYSEVDGYYISAVDTSEQLEFIFNFEDRELISSCRYFIELHFKPEFSSRSGIDEKWHHGATRDLKDSVMTLNLSPYLFIPVDEAVKLIGYEPFNVKTTEDKKYYVVERLSIRFECTDLKKTFKFYSSRKKND